MAAIIAMTTCVSYMLIQQFLPPVKLVTHEDDDAVQKLKTTSKPEEEKFHETITKQEEKHFEKSDETKLNCSSLMASND